MKGLCSDAGAQAGQEGDPSSHKTLLWMTAKNAAAMTTGSSSPSLPSKPGVGRRTITDQLMVTEDAVPSRRRLWPSSRGAQFATKDLLLAKTVPRSRMGHPKIQDRCPHKKKRRGGKLTHPAPNSKASQLFCCVYCT
jgi:hypothetical protein